MCCSWVESKLRKADSTASKTPIKKVTHTPTSETIKGHQELVVVLLYCHCAEKVSHQGHFDRWSHFLFGGLDDAVSECVLCVAGM